MASLDPADIDKALNAKNTSGNPHARQIQDIEDEYELHPLPEDGFPGTLGKGSYGTVRRFTRRDDLPHLKHIPSGPLAIKEIKKDRLTSQKSLKHIMVEIAVLRKLKHQNVIALYDVVHTTDKIFMVMEICSGGELYHFISRNRMLPPATAAIILKQLMQALSYIHQQHIVHRDIKPENVLIDTTDYHIKVIDFGLAKYCGPTGHPDFPQSPAPANQGAPGCVTPGGVPPSPLIASTPCGTDLYLSLESICGILQGSGVRKAWMSSRSKLPKVDIYAAGVIAYAMLTGKLPYRSAYKQKAAGVRQQRLADMKDMMNNGLQFPLSAQSLPHEALDCVRELMQNDPVTRPTAETCLQHVWLQNVQTPNRVPAALKGIVSSTLVTVAQGPINRTIEVPAVRRRKTPAAAPIPESVSTAHEGAQPSQAVKGPGTAPVRFVDELEESEKAPGTADPKNFKDAWAEMMRDVRREEDDDCEEKDRVAESETMNTQRTGAE
ncbi:putative serine/threonine-protein kinase fhkD [Diplonema papillatum]|nr:putative serine/threonine-protein kinase fhkD [Diplonema papillatum]